MRSRLQRDIDHFPGCRHFEIERLVDLRLQARDVIIPNMPAIFAKMGGDAVAARCDRKLGRTHGIGMAPTAGVADGGDVVDVNAKAETFHA
jgi:hypothetical protein